MTVIGTNRTLHRRVPAAASCAVLCVCVLLASLLVAAAQEADKSQPAREPAPASDVVNFFGAIGHWLDNAFSSIGGSFKDARSKIDNFNHEAGVAAKSTAGVAKDAADAVVRLPNTRIIRGHQNCPPAANGAPDCVAAANAMCKAQGFGIGKSLDTTAAEECPTAVTLGRRAAAPGECRTVTFITRAICQ